ncbi:MAG: hypothetical protein A3I62_01255 [Betaproteobacteria bacterium RIFCSPLOWO2_02_FULL_62_79]|nr:MAG: hypothetical protein A3I62_01255 [Betaproteobacteria bacterium RIFCSPLOWO2_02_FULL_62_79]
MKLAQTVALAGIFAAFSLATAAQTPSVSDASGKPIRLILGSPAGGPVDTIARILVQGWSEVMGRQIMVDNRAGAAGLIGADMAAKAPPDGNTLFFGFSGPLAIVPHLNPNTPYDPVTDFAPISQVATAPYVLLVHPSVPAKSVKGLIALAKSQPGKMHFSSGGNGVGIHMAGELLKVAAGVDIVHVPYKGAAPGMTALMAGEVDMMFNGLSSVLPHIKAGRVRALAVGGPKRSPLFPELPTVQESGFKFNTEGWYGVLGPRGTPQPVVTAQHQMLVRALETPGVKMAFHKAAVEPAGTTPQEFATLIRDEGAQWARVIKTAGLRMR